ncbi:hypothetical protein MOQ72_25760 [Saccharopolyspora sp. K220]|uniref:hypothetical protein n=1 Tax=Saccharopolyspora soli TaxID=2926618 RepID=UPI001F59F063|nr:hypothetical protein [Saccharopolyspora soli]MCI2420861.1 hypothetical protein [Saccharopolyspora soli]
MSKTKRACLLVVLAVAIPLAAEAQRPPPTTPESPEHRAKHERLTRCGGATNGELSPPLPFSWF